MGSDFEGYDDNGAPIYKMKRRRKKEVDSDEDEMKWYTDKIKTVMDKRRGRAVDREVEKKFEITDLNIKFNTHLKPAKGDEEAADLMAGTGIEIHGVKPSAKAV